MEYAAIAESQQHPLPQQQQQHDQQYQPPHSYDPTQIQAHQYDPASQTYYAYYPNTHHQYSAQQPYPYYPPDYSSTASGYQHQPLPSESLQPPGISAPPEAALHTPGANQHNAYYPTDYHGSYTLHQGLNPAAAAAVAKFTEVAEDAERAMAMEMHERHLWLPRNGGYRPMGGPPPPVHPGGAHLRPPIGRHPYRGGRRGGGSHRGGGRNNSGPHPSRSDSFRGRGRVGRGGRRFQQQSGSAAPPPKLGSDSAAREASEEAPVKTQAPALRPHRIPQVSWCELCMVDCNSLEILEQHLNGKRHKKNLQRLQEFENNKKRMAELQQQANGSQEQQQQILSSQQPHQILLPEKQLLTQSELQQEGSLTVERHQQTPTEQQPQQPEHLSNTSLSQEQLGPGFLSDKEILTVSEEGQSKHSSSGPAPPVPNTEDTDRKETDTEEQIQTGETDTKEKIRTGEQLKEANVESTAGVPAASTRKPTRGRGNWDDRKRFLKQGKMKFVRGAKRMRMSGRMMEEHPPTEPKETKEEPKFCSLCNVTCDTQAVFDCHLAGKKHNSRMKRSQGPMGSYTLHPSYASHPQPAAYVPRGYHQPIIYSHPGQHLGRQQSSVGTGPEITGQQPVNESTSMQQGVPDSHLEKTHELGVLGGKNSEPPHQQGVLKVIIDLGRPNVAAVESSQGAVMQETSHNFLVSDPKGKEATPPGSGVPPVDNAALPGAEARSAASGPGTEESAN